MAYTNEWLKFRKIWLKNNQPNHEGQFLCGICGKPVDAKDMEIDHILPRSNRPDLAYCPDNMQPTHSICNYRKGSKKWKPKINKNEYKLRRELEL